MKLEIARKLKRAAQFLGSDLDLDHEYSGRGMDGGTTAAVTVDSFAALLPIVAVAACRELKGMLVEDFAEELSHLRTDSMGRSTVVY